MDEEKFKKDGIPEAVAAHIPRSVLTNAEYNKVRNCLMCKSCKGIAQTCDPITEPSFRNLAPYGFILCCGRVLCETHGRRWYGCLRCGQNSHTSKSRLMDHLEKQHKRDSSSLQATKKRALDHEPSVIEDSWLFPTWEIKSDGDNFLEDALKDQEKASDDDVIRVFPEGDLECMHSYWIGEHNTPGSGYRRYGGFNYLVGRAFQKTRKVTAEKMPSFHETYFHFQSLQQFIESNDRQRQRQALLYDALRPLIPRGGKNDFFQNTELPDFKKSNTLYGFTGENCMWKHLPVPPVQNVDGIAYVKPIHIVKYAFSMGIEFDLKSVNQHVDVIEPIGPKACCHIEDSNVFKEILKNASEACRPLENHPCIFLAWAVDWRDGFGANRTKQNRKSVITHTLTIAPPRDKINAANNTFAVAIGSKASPGWAKVEHLYRRDMEEISDPQKPVLVYHGKLKKVFLVIVKIIASLEDKPERADVTDTLAPGSDVCRRFGVACKFKSPQCKDEVGAFLTQCRTGVHDNDLDFGWSSKYIKDDDEAAQNTLRLPSCNSCRKNRMKQLKRCMREIKSLGALSSSSSIGGGSPRACPYCCDWDMDSPSNRHKLSFPAPKEYPKTRAAGGPAPPKYREVGLVQLIAVDLTFPFLVQAAKFAFYNLSRARQKDRWTKGVASAYLTTCGINDRCLTELHKCAQRQWKENLPEADYSPTTKSLGDFNFKASWLSSLDLDRYIELLMHQIFLGLAAKGGNFGLMTIWSKEEKSRYKDQTFRKSAQPLLKYVRKFHLSWLEVHPFSEGDKSTGGWVSENWLAWVRLSKVGCGWLYREGQIGVRYGSNDVQRLVNSFVALVAQLLTHTGITRTNLVLIDCYIKEYMSCVREMDVRARHGKIGKKNSATNGKYEVWYMKSNYLSLFNIVNMIEKFGPLINLWDGGGKGERFIQLVKPHIPRGVSDMNSFFERLMERIYKVRFLNHNDDLRADVNETSKENAEVEDQPEYTIDETGVLITSYDLLEDDDNRTAASRSEKVTDADDLSESNDEPSAEEPPMDEASLDNSAPDGDAPTVDAALVVPDDDESAGEEKVSAEFSFPTNQRMAKTRTIYLYRNKNLVEQAILGCEPVSGIIVKERESSLVLYCVYRDAHKSFGWVKMGFDDNDGYNYGGLYYAPLVPDFNVESVPSQSVAAIKDSALMSAVAIPMRYALGRGDATMPVTKVDGTLQEHMNNAQKYCVLTNWWKERMENGKYELPGLNFSMYKSVEEDEDVENEDGVYEGVRKNDMGQQLFIV